MRNPNFQACYLAYLTYLSYLSYLPRYLPRPVASLPVPFPPFPSRLTCELYQLVSRLNKLAV